MEFFTKTVKGRKPLTIFAKSSILHFWVGSEYASDFEFWLKLKALPLGSWSWKFAKFVWIVHEKVGHIYPKLYVPLSLQPVCLQFQCNVGEPFSMVSINLTNKWCYIVWILRWKKSLIISTYVHIVLYGWLGLNVTL